PARAPPGVPRRHRCRSRGRRPVEQALRCRDPARLAATARLRRRRLPLEVARAGPPRRPPPGLTIVLAASADTCVGEGRQNALVITVEPLRPELDEAAARLISDAFLDDPAFVAIGPDDPKRRWASLLRLNRAALKVARRWGGPVHSAMEDGRLLATSVVFDEGRWPAPKRSLLCVLGFMLAGLG